MPIIGHQANFKYRRPLTSNHLKKSISPHLTWQQQHSKPTEVELRFVTRKCKDQPSLTFSGKNKVHRLAVFCKEALVALVRMAAIVKVAVPVTGVAITAMTVTNSMTAMTTMPQQ